MPLKYEIMFGRNTAQSHDPSFDAVCLTRNTASGGRLLWVTLWFPFSLFAPIYDLEHVIPLDAIMSVRRSHFLGRRTFLLSYRDSAGGTHTLRLIPRQPDEFIQRLGVKVDETPAHH